jgi:hypothetical protein
MHSTKEDVPQAAADGPVGCIVYVSDAVSGEVAGRGQGN